MGEKKDALRMRAEDYYIANSSVTQGEVAELFKVAPRTVGTWVKKYNWEEKRTDYHGSPVRIGQLLLQELARVSRGEAKTMDADAVSKLMAALDRCNKKADPTVVNTILKDLDAFTAGHDAAFAAKSTKYHRLFLQHRISLES